MTPTQQSNFLKQEHVLSFSNYALLIKKQFFSMHKVKMTNFYFTKIDKIVSLKVFNQF